MAPGAAGCRRPWPPVDMLPAAAVPAISALCAVEPGAPGEDAGARVFTRRPQAEGWLARRAASCTEALDPYIRGTDFAHFRLFILASSGAPPAGLMVTDEAVEIFLPRRSDDGRPAFSRVHAMRIPREPARVDLVPPPEDDDKAPPRP